VTVTVCYIHFPGSEKSQSYLYRFFTSYHQYPPGADCRVVLVSNAKPFDDLNRVYTDKDWQIVYRPSNEGKDIGAHIEVARTFKPELIVSFGQSVYFHREGWLRRLLEARVKNGPGMYGMLSSNLVRPHLNTTCFACDADLLAHYPEHVVTQEHRYSFEHGKFPFWKWVETHGKQVRLVTFDGDWRPVDWRVPPNIFWRGDQSNCLVWCHHTDKFANAQPATRLRWSAGADTRFR
jgi:hypothetical protein